MNMQNISLGVALVAIPASIVLAIFVSKLLRMNKAYVKRFSGIIDADQELEKIIKEKSDLEQSIEKLKSDYKEKKVLFNKLVETAAIYNEEIELAELGFYKPHYDFGTSEEYKDAIEEARKKEKEMIAAKTAIVCNTEWSVSGSAAKGRTMINRGVTLTARAFNNECDAAISRVRWNNVQRVEQRIEKAFDAINRMNESNDIKIAPEYLKLKLDELRLTHEYEEKKQQEKEEQAEIRHQMREEAKLEQETERALKEEEKYQKLLDKAKTEAEQVAGEKFEKLQEKIGALTQELVEAHEKSERAKSMAQQTKAGHIYVISNVGSFGENVYKIGMTRRLDPLDRIKELGDASVPFCFDIHAMIYSTDAPALEKELHNAFERKRLNLVNNRKEFFNTEIETLEREVRKISQEAKFVLTTEAREYRESNAIRAQRERQKEKNDIRNELPEEL